MDYMGVLYKMGGGGGEQVFICSFYLAQEYLVDRLPGIEFIPGSSTLQMYEDKEMLKGQLEKLMDFSIFGPFCQYFNRFISPIRLCHSCTLNYTDRRVGFVCYALVGLLYFLCWPFLPIPLFGRIWYAIIYLWFTPFLAVDIGVFVLSTIVIYYIRWHRFHQYYISLSFEVSS